MTKEELSRLKRLENLARADEIYNVWYKSRLEFAEQFQQYADAQPQAVRNMLWGYACSGEMLLQRMINLACENMDYIEKE